jgi:iron complex outermembrane recepter protein
MCTRFSVGAVAMATSVGLCVSLHAQTANPTNPLPEIHVSGKRPASVRHRVARRPTATAARTPAPVAGGQTGTGQQGAPGAHKPFSNPLPANIPAVIETVTAQEIAVQTNAITATDAIKYLPSIDLRTRYEGEQNSMIGFRTVTEDTPAQSLVYVDGMLVSNLLGNYYYYPPVTQMATPNEIARVDVIYGPFSALYPGNSYGGVLTFTTRMPDKLEIHLATKGFDQQFGLYETNQWYPGWNGSLAIGDRFNDFSFWFTYDHLTTHSQPLEYANLLPCTQYFSSNTCNNVYSSTSPLPVSGGSGWVSPIGQQGFIAGANNIYTQDQGLYKLKLAYDFTPTTRLTYTGAFFDFTQYSGVQSYIYGANGAPIYNAPSGTIAVGGQYYNLVGEDPAFQVDQRLMEGLELKHDGGGVFDYDLVVSHMLMLHNVTQQSTNYGVDPTGQDWNQSGTGWFTADARGIWRPEQNVLGTHEVSFGGHFDQYTLGQTYSYAPVWTSFADTFPFYQTSGDTQTEALYVQDAWSFLPRWKLVLGGREEFWNTFDGANLNYGTLPASAFFDWGTLPPTAVFPSRSAQAFSPKASLSYQAAQDFLLRASFGHAERFPTVSELYQFQAFTYGEVVPNPNLLPETVNSYDLTGEYTFGKDVARLSYFHEDRWDEIISQTFQNATGIFTSYQNVGKTQFNGVEGAVQLKDVGTRGLDVNTSVTYVQSEILSDPGYYDPNFPGLSPVGAQYPLIPKWRAKLVATYHPTDQWSISGAMRYASNSFSTLDNTDIFHDTYTGASGYVVFDARATYKFDKNWSMAAGMNNIGKYEQYDYHPFAQRTLFGELHYDYVAD